MRPAVVDMNACKFGATTWGGHFMPEHISRLDSTLPEFPAAAGRGTIFSPLAQDMHEARMRSHTVQTIALDAQALYELWKNVALAPRWMEYVVSAEPKSPTLT